METQRPEGTGSTTPLVGGGVGKKEGAGGKGTLTTGDGEIIRVESARKPLRMPSVDSTSDMGTWRSAQRSFILFRPFVYVGENLLLGIGKLSKWHSEKKEKSGPDVVKVIQTSATKGKERVDSVEGKSGEKKTSWFSTNWLFGLVVGKKDKK